MSQPKQYPQFDRRIFWDVNFDTLDYDGKAGFIIERVFERGDVPDIRMCRRYYGDEKNKTSTHCCKMAVLTNHLSCLCGIKQRTNRL